MRGDQLARQWQLIQRLARSRSGAHLDELADELDCVRRTVYRDLDALMYAGFPVISEKREGRTYYRFLESFRLGDVPFTPDEVMALAFGEDLLRTLEGTVFHDSIRSALTKIRAGLGPELTSYLELLGQTFRVLPGPHKNYARFRETIQSLNDAVMSRCSVHIEYRTGRTGSVAERNVDPYRVWYRSGGLYVVGFDHRSEEIRTFAVDRIQRIDSTGEPFEIQKGFDFDDYMASSFGVIAEPAVGVRIRFEGRWSSYVEERTWHASQKITPGPDGSIELSMEVGGTADLRTWILSFGSGAEVLEPQSLREEVIRELEASIARYDEVPDSTGRSSSEGNTGRRSSPATA
ncbi:WYL domain-containing protein [Myxococcota bacterium]|nr:WYL domain-containing protein [Myxococcota bacterium]